MASSSLVNLGCCSAYAPAQATQGYEAGFEVDLNLSRAWGRRGRGGSGTRPVTGRAEQSQASDAEPFRKLPTRGAQHPGASPTDHGGEGREAGEEATERRAWHSPDGGCSAEADGGVPGRRAADPNVQIPPG